MPSMFGDYVRKSRERLGPEVSQREFARRLQARGLPYDNSAISRLESGDTKRMPPGLIGALAEELHWSAAQLAEAMALAEEDLRLESAPTEAA